jgi:hypothetical protein
VIGWFIGFIGAIVIAIFSDDSGSGAVGFLIPIPFIYLIWCGLFIREVIRKYHYNQKILVELAQRLEPLAPTAQELEEARHHLRMYPYKEVAKWNPLEIMDAIKEAGSKSAG